MNYLVTGATGFIGRFVTERLLARPGSHVFALVRESSASRFDALRARFPQYEGQLHPVWGDVTDPGLGGEVPPNLDHVFHLAAVYDLGMDDAAGDRVNVEGTRNVVRFCNGHGVRLQHVSSIAVAGMGFDGVFTEDMLDEGQPLDHPYFRTKFLAERVVREECTAPYRIYRPGAVVGSSQTGEMDKVDGPYYFFGTIRLIRDRIPAWVPLPFVEGGRIPIAPVDYVAAAIDAIAHLPGLDGGCFQLLQTNSPTAGELVKILLRAADRPGIVRTFGVPLPRITGPLRSLVRAARSTAGIPVTALEYVTNRATFDDSNARRALDGTGIRCPDVAGYAGKLWRYWELHLDPVRVPRGLPQAVGGKAVLITGASSGIGFATARKVAAAGARTILVARTKEKLDELQQLIAEGGGEAHVYPCDLNDMQAVDSMAEAVLRDLGHVDVLVNNAGRSIRRAVSESLDRFHDVERTMQLNYFGAVRLIFKLLPSMAERRSGHIINVSSIGVQANAPRFSAYVASKSALDAFGRCLSSEVRSHGIDITTVYMPLVRTPMISPTTIYRYFPAWTPDQAADAIVKGMVARPKSVATMLGRAAAISYAVWPRVNDFVLSRGYRLFPTSAAAKGKATLGEEERPTLEQVVFATLFRGEHW